MPGPLAYVYWNLPQTFLLIALFRKDRPLHGFRRHLALGENFTDKILSSRGFFCSNLKDKDLL